MTLPKLDFPVHPFTMPSTGKTYKIRPFLSKEEKLLLIAMEEQDPNKRLAAIAEATCQLIHNCSFGEIDPNKLTIFDVEWFFLQLRIISKGEASEIGLRCNAKTDTGKCGHITPTSFDMRRLQVERSPEHTTKIMLSDTIGIVMRYPNYKMFLDIQSRLQSGKKSVELTDDVLIDCIDMVFKGDQTFSMKDYTREEQQDFIDNMTSIASAEIEKFFKTMPVVRGTIDYTCEACGTEHKNITVEGLESFFG
jgi:hypothetical protein